MRVLVAGGTGFIGSRLVEALDGRGQEVTVLARHPEESTLPDRVRAVAADVTDHAAVEAAVDDVDAVVNLVALSPLFEPRGGNERHLDVHLGGTEVLVTAAESGSVSRFVQLSALGADVDGATAYLRAKGRAEEVVRASTLDWTVLRPSVVFGRGGEFVPFTRRLTTPYLTALPGGGKTRFQPIWVDDLASMIADALECDEHGEQTYELGGPEKLTLAAVVREVYRAAGKPFRVVPLPMVAARLGLTVAGVVPGIRFGPDQYRSLRLDNTVDDNDVRAFGVDPTELRTLADYLAEASTGEPRDDDGRSRSPLTAAMTLVLFVGLTLTSWLPAVVDIYSFVGFRILFLPSYLVTAFLYDGRLEQVVYALEAVGLPASHALWEVGRIATYYLVAVAVVVVSRIAMGRSRRRRRRPSSRPPIS